MSDTTSIEVMLQRVEEMLDALSSRDQSSSDFRARLTNWTFILAIKKHFWRLALILQNSKRDALHQLLSG